MRSSAITPYHLHASTAERSLGADGWVQKLGSVPTASIAEKQGFTSVDAFLYCAVDA